MTARSISERWNIHSIFVTQMNQSAAALPRDYDSLRQRLLEMRDELPPRLVQVAAYATGFPDEMAFGTTASISTAIGVQPSTLVRFARALGYDGFTDMQSVFRERLRDNSSAYAERLSALPRTGNDILEGFLDAAHASLERAAAIPPERFANAARLLAGAETIYLIARKRSFPITSYMAYSFGKLGIRYQLLPSVIGADREMLSFASPRDAAFVASFSPYASETVEATRELASRKVSIVSLTDSAFSPLTALSDEWLELPETSFSDFRSLSASIALAMALVVAVAQLRG